MRRRGWRKARLLLAVTLPALALVAAHPIVNAFEVKGDANIGSDVLWMCAPLVAFAGAVFIRPTDARGLATTVSAWVVLAIAYFPVLVPEGNTRVERTIFALVVSLFPATTGTAVGRLARVIVNHWRSA